MAETQVDTTATMPLNAGILHSPNDPISEAEAIAIFKAQLPKAKPATLKMLASYVTTWGDIFNPSKDFILASVRNVSLEEKNVLGSENSIPVTGGTAKLVVKGLGKLFGKGAAKEVVTEGSKAATKDAFKAEITGLSDEAAAVLAKTDDAVEALAITDKASRIKALAKVASRVLPKSKKGKLIVYGGGIAFIAVNTAGNTMEGKDATPLAPGIPALTPNVIIAPDGQSATQNGKAFNGTFSAPDGSGNYFTMQFSGGKPVEGTQYTFGVDGAKYATDIATGSQYKVGEPTVKTTPSPTPTPTPTPTLTSTATPTPTPTPTVTPTTKGKSLPKPNDSNDFQFVLVDDKIRMYFKNKPYTGDVVKKDELGNLQITKYKNGQLQGKTLAVTPDGRAFTLERSGKSESGNVWLETKNPYTMPTGGTSTPSVTPTPSMTPTPGVTPKPNATPTATPTSTPSVVPTPTPSPSSTGGTTPPVTTGTGILGTPITDVTKWNADYPALTDQNSTTAFIKLALAAGVPGASLNATTGTLRGTWGMLGSQAASRGMSMESYLKWVSAYNLKNFGEGDGGPKTNVQYTPTSKEDIKNLLNAQLKKLTGREATDAQFNAFYKTVHATEMKKGTKTVTTSNNGTSTSITTPGYGQADILTDAEKVAQKSEMYKPMQNLNVFGAALSQALGVK